MRDRSLCVAVKQAMRHEMGLTFREIANYTGVCLKNVCSHVYAKHGSKVRAWNERGDAQQAEALTLAKEIYYSSLIQYQNNVQSNLPG